MSFVELITFLATLEFQADITLINPALDRIAGLEDNLGVYHGFAEDDANIYSITIVWSNKDVSLRGHPEILSSFASLAASPFSHYQSILNGSISASVDAPITEVLSLRIEEDLNQEELGKIWGSISKEINEGKVEGGFSPCVWGFGKDLGEGMGSQAAGTPFLSYCGWVTMNAHLVFQEEFHALAASDLARGAILTRLMTIAKDLRVYNINYHKYSLNL
ncbi:hypothetical protein BJ165DRAFT_1489288 [Panaeolus papilionaceus]|nr:hypothetical protein BJ165DRAFT_1489288 [Panaeolus papilionaceus]